MKHLFVAADDHTVRWEVGLEKQDYLATEKKNFGPTILNGTETEVNGTLTDVTHTPYVYMPPNKRDFVFASLQDQWQLTESLLLNIGARFDDYSDAGSTFNPRLGLTKSWVLIYFIILFSFRGINSSPAFSLKSRLLSLSVNISINSDSIFAVNP